MPATPRSKRTRKIQSKKFIQGDSPTRPEEKALATEPSRRSFGALAIGSIGAVGGFFGGVFGGVASDFLSAFFVGGPGDPIGLKDARLIYPQKRAIPFLNQPTIVALRNDGEREALIESIAITGHWRPVPTRRTAMGLGETIVVDLEPKHFTDRNRAEFFFKRPRIAPAAEYTSIEVGIVDPLREGWTFAGKMAVSYDGAKQVEVEIEIDALSKKPERIS